MSPYSNHWVCRANRVRSFIASFKLSLEHHVVPVQYVHGSTAVGPNIQTLTVRRETLRGAQRAVTQTTVRYTVSAGGSNDCKALIIEMSLRELCAYDGRINRPHQDWERNISKLVRTRTLKQFHYNSWGPFVFYVTCLEDKTGTACKRLTH